LARIQSLNLLRQLYGKIIIPEAVWQEVVIEGAGQPGAEEIKGAAWIRRQAVANRSLVLALRQELDAGEAEAIVLTLEQRADILLMDERLGRDTARHLGLRYTGLIGVLIEAKHKGLVSVIKPQLDALRNDAGFWVNDALYARVLKDEQQ
jgi:predicted nucleic acid-binding protein